IRITAIFKKSVDTCFIKNTSLIYYYLNLPYNLSFYNKFLLINTLFLLFILQKEQNKKHFLAKETLKN
ncbi:MAG: hypothetical protein ABTA16_20920, partial [Niallia sp.]